MSAFALQRILPVLLASALACGSVCAQEGLSKAESEKLDSLRFSYDLEREEITQKQFVEPLEKLRKGYREKMQKVQDRFSQAQDLTNAIAARTAAKTDPTVATINADVKEIANVQKTFIEAQERIQKGRDESLVKLARSHAAQLTAIKDRLTKAKRLDSALVVQQAIDELEYPSLILGGSKKFKDGLVAHYPFNGNAKDVSGNGNHGVVKGGATLTTDRRGNANSAYSFDGKDDYVEVTLSPELRELFSLSVSIWVLVDSSQSRGPNGYNQILSSWGGGGDGRVWSIGTGGGGSHLAVDSGPNDPHGPLFNAPRTPIKNQVWLHVVYAHGSKGAALYLNGKAIVESKVGFPLKPFIEPLIFGADNKGVRANFKGCIDDTRIYNRTLSAFEVSQLFALEKP
jgi:hypothetical protein